jgi:hypothetical protein
VLTERTREKPDAIRVRDDTGCAAMTQADTECLALTQDSAVYSYVLYMCPLQDVFGVFGGKSSVHMALSRNLRAVCVVPSYLLLCMLIDLLFL